MGTENGHGGVSEEWLEIPPGLITGKTGSPLSERRARLWALVLDARAVPCRLDFSGGGWRLLAPADFLAAAIYELCQFEEENRNWPPPSPPPHPLSENTLATLSVLILLAIFHNIIQLDVAYSPDWIDLGNAQASKILDGQWWRLVTALTLHADDLHLVSNLGIGGIFILLLCRELGSGLAWTLMLGSGILGNLANAWVQLHSHSSVGASTLVFGAVGILASLSAVRYRQQLHRRWALPIASALALLALLGTEGRNTDLGAHLFGFAFGIGLGLIAEYVVGRYGHPGRALNAVLALLCIGVVALAWWMALIVHVTA
jgi:rhomboid protease GluP